jgi:nucleoid DNA-binding protein
MPIQYSYVGYKNISATEKEETCIRPQIHSTGTIDERKMAEHMMLVHGFTKGEALRSVESVMSTIEHFLKEGKTINIRGYGSYMLSAQFNKKKINNKDNSKLDKSMDRRAESIEVKNVVLRATPEMKKRIGHNNFERIDKPQK